MYQIKVSTRQSNRKTNEFSPPQGARYLSPQTSLTACLKVFYTRVPCLVL